VTAGAYVAAWLGGLAVPVPAPGVGAPAGEIASSFAGEGGAVAARALLVHGVAAIALLLVVRALARTTGRTVLVAGAVAVGLSLVQLVLELVAAGPVLAGSDDELLGRLVHAVDRIDGAKLLALAVLVLAAARAGVLRRTGVVLGALLLLGGAGFLVLSPVVALAAYPALPLLLVWVAVAGARA
jgi:hypothetical protein